MRLVRRRSVVSGAVVVGLLVPMASVASVATAVGRTATVGTSSTPTARDDVLHRIAVNHDSGKVVLSVKVRGGAGAAASLTAVVRAVASQGGLQRRLLRQVSTVSVEVPQAVAARVAATLRQRADVARVDPVVLKKLSYIPNDQLYPATAPYLNAVAAPSAWDVHRGDPAVKIAVVDSGVDVSHPDLAGRVTATYNAVTHGTDVTDTLGHGTFVAGVAAATSDNAIGIAGASMGASVMAVKVADASDQIWTDNEAAGIIWATDNGAKVINLSLGSDTPSQVESDAVAYAVGKGVLVVAAAGNEAVTSMSYPAAYPNVVAVGATDAAGHRASFSQHGAWVTVGAPGTGITGTAPTAGSTFFKASYDVGDGTSFSSPIVAAEAALLWSMRPSVSAADVRAAMVRSAHGYAGQDLGAGQVDFRAAEDALRPDTAPTLTAPAAASSVAGVVQVSATSSAAKVRFSLDGVPLTGTVPVVGGAANTTWSTWGLPDGAHTITAVDCSVDDLCNTAISQAAVTLANGAPTITSPTPSQLLSGSATFTATAPGGAVAFVVDGVRRGLVTAAPYALTLPISALSDGTHSVTAVSCSLAGVCNGGSSSAVTFQALSLHPTILARIPATFSPNADGRYDTTTVTYSLPDTETVRVLVHNAAGTVVLGPVNLGTLGAGTHTVVWNGMTYNGLRAASGSYSIELATSRVTTTGTIRGSVLVNAVVDLVPASVSRVSGSGGWFYPYPDGYIDHYTPGFVLSEPATVTMTIRSSTGAIVRTLTASRPAGSTSMTWDGRNAAGTLLGAGTYYWTLLLQDVAGNRSITGRYAAVLNRRYLVSKTAVFTRTGAQFVSAGGTDPTCATASAASSDFRPNGVWMNNMCSQAFDGFQIAGATYHFAVPSAINYTSMRIDAYGRSLSASKLGAGFSVWGTHNTTFAPEVATSATTAWRTIGWVNAAGLVSSTHVVEGTVYVPNPYRDNDFDLGSVRLVVVYKVLS
jgi:subtilisin family serine protease